MQGTVVSRTLESLPGLSDLIQLRTGAAYAVDSASLALALLAGPSQAGEWVGIVGATDLGFEAAAGFGVDLGRTIVVPHPDEHWLSVTAGLVDVATLVLVKPPVLVTERQAERIRSRLRQKDATLICWGEWPRCEARLALRASSWIGLGRGHGHLIGNECVSTSTGEAHRRDRLICGCPTPTGKFAKRGPGCCPSTRSKRADHDRLAHALDSRSTDHRSTAGERRSSRSGRLVPGLAGDRCCGLPRTCPIVADRGHRPRRGLRLLSGSAAGWGTSGDASP